MRTSSAKSPSTHEVGKYLWSRGSVLLGFIAFFLLAPKIDVMSFLRIEDFVFIFMLPFLAWRYQPYSMPPPVFMKWYLAYIALAIISSILNYSNVGAFGLVNVLRQVQYLVWFAVGSQVALSVPERSFRRCMEVVSAALIIWWLGEMSGIIPKMGKFIGAQGRVTLNTSGPYEISLVVLFLMFLVKSRLTFIGLIGILLATQSRITLVAAIFVFLVFYWRQIVIFLAPVSLIFLSLMIIEPDFLLASRFTESLSPLEMWQAFLSQIHAAPVISNLSDYRYFAYDSVWDQVGGSSDVSFELRIIRWSLIVKSLTSDIVHLLFGWGPGAWGAAVDSHFIRFLGEVGLIGVLSIVGFLFSSITSSSSPKQYRESIIALAICSIFIDVMTSSKIMSLLWVISGYYCQLSFQSTLASKLRKN